MAQQSVPVAKDMLDGKQGLGWRYSAGWCPHCALHEPVTILHAVSNEQCNQVAWGKGLVSLCTDSMCCIVWLCGCSHHQLLPPGCAGLHQQDSKDLSEGLLQVNSGGAAPR
jgi:hypothetical protein